LEGFLRGECLEGFLRDEVRDLDIDGLVVSDGSNWDNNAIIVIIVEEGFSDGHFVCDDVFR